MKQKWLLCDMHLHSEYSKLNKPSEKDRVKKMTAEEFVKIMLLNNVEIFSITDHNYFSSQYYNDIEEYIVTNNLQMKVINGTELDVYVELNNGTKECFHICVYFEDKVNREKLEESINNLYKDGNKPQFTDIINELHILKSKFIIIPHGDKSRGIFKILKNASIAESENYYKYAMYKIFNAFDVKPGFYGKNESIWAAEFFEKTKKFNQLLDSKGETELLEVEKNITSRFKDVNFELTLEEVEIYNYILEYGSYFAYFTFSDWHNAEKYEPKINNFIFGTLELAFESFEMATLDPLSRIEHSEEKDIDIPKNILQKVSFTIAKTPHEIFFSPGLNAIVGKRGSGKSLLLSVIKNLEDKDAPDGAIKKYHSLGVKDIYGENRGNIKISMGSLGSVAFLTQDEIKNIFEKPDAAQKGISSNFIEIKSIDLSEIEKIINIGEKIIPYNTNYKNLTANILSIRQLNDYNYDVFDELKENEIKKHFFESIKNLELLSKSISKLYLNVEEIDEEILKIKFFQKKYLKLISLYNNIISENNGRINILNQTKNSNQITTRQNINIIQKALSEIRNNFDIQLNIEKLKLSLKKFKIEKPPVEIAQKGKYLFVTYYEIPENINELLEEKIMDTITRGGEIKNIYKYVNGDEAKKLKVGYSSIVDELKKYLRNDIFKSKKEFYEIKERKINYKEKIKNMDELRREVENNNITNLTYASPGMKSVAYLDMLFDLEETILILDQPEDNIDNDYISNYLVPNIKSKKRIKQLIFVTHNPSVAVYGDAFNYIYVENNEQIKYTNYLIEKVEDKEKLIKILEGGRKSFSNRNKKFGDILGEEEYGNK